jgi:NADH-quinone oxidoreductase subunit K
MNHELALLNNYLTVGAVLFGIGMTGFLSRRNMIVMFLAAEMMLQGISVSLVAWSRFHNHWGGQMLVVFIIAVAACEAAIALALVQTLFRRRGNLDIAVLQDLREDSEPPLKDEPLADDPDERPLMPHLPPAGIEPDVPPEETEYRPRV